MKYVFVAIGAAYIFGKEKGWYDGYQQGKQIGKSLGRMSGLIEGAMNRDTYYANNYKLKRKF